MANPYAAPADFTEFGLPAAALDGFAGSVQAHLDAGAGIVDSYLRGRYATGQASAELKIAVCQLAAASILTVRGWDPEVGSDATVIAQAERVRSWLDRISDGKVNLNDLTVDTHEGGPIVASRAGGSTEFFGSYVD